MARSLESRSRSPDAVHLRRQAFRTVVVLVAAFGSRRSERACDHEPTPEGGPRHKRGCSYGAQQRHDECVGHAAARISDGLTAGHDQLHDQLPSAGFSYSPAYGAGSPEAPLTAASTACSTTASNSSTNASSATAEPAGSAAGHAHTPCDTDRPDDRKQRKPPRLGAWRPEPWTHGAAGEGAEIRSTASRRRSVGRSVEGQGSVEVAATRRSGICPVCGASFDPTRYQIVVETMGAMPFDRIECAEIALAERRSIQAYRQRRARRRSLRTAG